MFLWTKQPVVIATCNAKDTAKTCGMSDVALSFMSMRDAGTHSFSTLTLTQARRLRANGQRGQQYAPK